MIGRTLKEVPMSRFVLLALPLLAACSLPEPSSADPAALTRNATELVVCDAPDADATAEQVDAADAAVALVEADGDLACANCTCDCSQAKCAVAGCVAQWTGQGDCRQSGSTCNGTTCSCDCYTVLGKACPAPGSGSGSPERITLTNGVGGVVKACDFK
jgi:hypothetical protein